MTRSERGFLDKGHRLDIPKGADTDILDAVPRFMKEIYEVLGLIKADRGCDPVA